MIKSIHPTFELVPLGETASFTVREFKLMRFTSPWHLHPEIELTSIVSGTGTRFVGDNASAFRPGDLILIGSNTPHYWRSEDCPTEESHSVVLQFREDCLGTEFFHRPEMAGVLRLLRNARRGIAFPSDAREAVAERLKALPDLCGAERVATFIAILARLAHTRRIKLLSGASFLNATDFPGHDHIHRACRYVFERLSEPIRLTEAAKAAAVSPETLCRLFKRAIGKTFFDFVNDARIGHACVQLVETDSRIAEIAYAVGFNTLANFNRRFRERKKMTPREFRGRLRNLRKW